MLQVGYRGLKLYSGERPPEDNWPEPVKSLIADCFRSHQRDRPKFSQIVNMLATHQMNSEWPAGAVDQFEAVQRTGGRVVVIDQSTDHTTHQSRYNMNDLHAWVREICDDSYVQVINQAGIMDINDFVRLGVEELERVGFKVAHARRLKDEAKIASEIRASDVAQEA